MRIYKQSRSTSCREYARRNSASQTVSFAPLGYYESLKLSSKSFTIQKNSSISLLSYYLFATIFKKCMFARVPFHSSSRTFVKGCRVDLLCAMDSLVSLYGAQTLMNSEHFYMRNIDNNLITLCNSLSNSIEKSTCMCDKTHERNYHQNKAATSKAHTGTAQFYFQTANSNNQK